ncbi:lysostaphin resistance A-like protein [Novosphingobium sp.]|uniref:CPBP family intramembrane glutamic endopeptidase n=1 Tax=Novosphingobium sp. TaxID=1874826 RepID=UPI0038B9F9DB
MLSGTRRLVIAFFALAIWTALTVSVSLWQAGPNTPLGTLVQARFVLGPPVAATFLLLLIHFNGWWHDIGLNAARPARSIWVLWLPSLYIVALTIIGLLITPPTPMVIAIVAINTAIVGFSEELAFRGVFWGAVRRLIPFWPGFLLVSAMFGSVHMLNGFLTGDWAGALAQSINAAASGAAYLAFRIRNRSIVPMMVIHWLWDFAVFLVGAGSDPVPGATVDPLKSVMYSSVLVGPILLWGFFLIRNERVRSGWRDDVLAGA